MLLPKPKRRAIAAIYAFAREVDDVADDPGLDDVAKRERLEELRARLEGDAGDERDVRRARRRAPAISDPAARRSTTSSTAESQDTEQARYATFDELRGVLPARRRGGRRRVRRRLRRRTSRQRAETLGVALQLINIIRDVAEDWELGRVYLPQDELAEFGVSEAGHRAPVAAPAEWRALMAHQAQRARAHLAEGRTLLPRLDRRSAACVAAFANLYAATLDRIEERGYDVFGGPPQLSPLTKLRIVGAGVILR